MRPLIITRFCTRFAFSSNSSSRISSNTACRANSCYPFVASSGERAVAIAGAVVCSPTCSNICRTTADSVVNPTRCTRPPQLRPQIVRPLSGLRGANNYAHLLWLGCLGPRHQLPACLRRNQCLPRRVRRQHHPTPQRRPCPKARVLQKNYALQGQELLRIYILTSGPVYFR